MSSLKLDSLEAKKLKGEKHELIATYFMAIKAKADSAGNLSTNFHELQDEIKVRAGRGTKLAVTDLQSLRRILSKLAKLELISFIFNNGELLINVFSMAEYKPLDGNKAQHRSSVSLVKKDREASSSLSCDAAENIFHAVFWPNYPRKVAKPRALKAFLSIKEIKGASEEEILKFAGVIASDVIHKQKVEWSQKSKELTPHPATYLNDRRWQDEALDILSEEIKHDKRAKKGRDRVESLRDHSWANGL